MFGCQRGKLVPTEKTRRLFDKNTRDSVLLPTRTIATKNKASFFLISDLYVLIISDEKNPA